MLKESDILYENNSCYVIDGGKSAYEIYQNKLAHAVRVGIIGKNYGIERAILEADKRANMTK